MKDRTPIGHVVEAHLTAEPFDDLLHDAQTETGSTLLPGIRGVGLRKLFEDVRLEIGGHSRAVVPHRYADDLAAYLHQDQHFVVLRENLIAFESRFVTTWASRSESALTSPCAEVTSRRTRMP